MQLHTTGCRNLPTSYRHHFAISAGKHVSKPSLGKESVHFCLSVLRLSVQLPVKTPLSGCCIFLSSAKRSLSTCQAHQQACLATCTHSDEAECCSSPACGTTRLWQHSPEGTDKRKPCSRYFLHGLPHQKAFGA